MIAWPDFAAPPQHENPASGWDDPALPDFRVIWVVVNGAVQQDAYALQPENTSEGYCTLSAEPDFCAHGVTHWRYAEPTPLPPETSK